MQDKTPEEEVENKIQSILNEYYSDPHFLSDAAIDALMVIMREYAQQEAGKWISAEDRLPEKEAKHPYSANVFCISALGTLFIGWYDHDLKYWCPTRNVTHWFMPPILSSPPKTKTDALS